MYAHLEFTATYILPLQYIVDDFAYTVEAQNGSRIHYKGTIPE